MQEKHAHIGEAVKAHRTAQGLTQAELCERMGWEGRMSNLSDIERGERSVQFDTALLLASALGLHISELVFSIHTEYGKRSA